MFETMPRSLAVVLVCLAIGRASCENVLRGEQTRYAMSCSITSSNSAHWLGPQNASIISNSARYEIKSSPSTVQLIIDHLTSDDAGEYICRDNATNEILQRYQLQIGSMAHVLLPFFLTIIALLILIPLCWLVGRKYSGLGQ